VVTSRHDGYSGRRLPRGWPDLHLEVSSGNRSR
jgi:hypothetical protein